jgi:hypothetical protein
MDNIDMDDEDNEDNEDNEDIDMDAMESEAVNLLITIFLEAYNNILDEGYYSD